VKATAMTRHGRRYVLTWSAFLGCLIGFLLTSLRDGASSHPFAPLMFLFGALIIFGLGVLEQAGSHGGRPAAGGGSDAQ
jgi:hypothetical protein